MKANIYDIVIIGSGISGLSLGHFISKADKDFSQVILEKKSRVGGAIRTFRQDGFLAEYGPHGFLDNIEESRELLEDYKDSLRIQKASLNSFVRYLCLDGKLNLIPQSPPKIIRSPILPVSAKLRVLSDLWKAPLQGEPSVSEWVEYRFGKRILPFADAVLTGTYAGDFEKLSIDAVMPALRRMEFEAGSVLKGVIRQKKQSKKASDGLPSMVSFQGGIEELTQCMGEKLAPLTGHPVTSLKRQGNEWEIKTTQKTFYAKTAVVALNINQALELLKSLEPPPVMAVPEARIANILLGFDASAEIPFGFGYLAPRGEKRFTLGSLFSTHMFPGRAPAQTQMIEVLVGGILYPERVNLDDEELVSKALEDVGQLIKLPKPPVFKRVIRSDIGIPQLEIGHKRLTDYKERLENNHPGLSILGFGWNGIGMNDMIRESKKLAGKILDGKKLSDTPEKAKGIYF
ncbi:MAG: protoporphyrinogen oxidase [Deltaproteobacteria bacterium]|nr:protoporphyrinogen oxidase [Deltaproteobacteria bacterium]